jgi:FkbM family methyltransferase
MFHYYSQQGEDIYVVYNYLNKRNPDAVFVELGGFDGKTHSNSKFFEDTLGFGGVLIEPTRQYDMMVKNRPKCKNYRFAIASTHGQRMMTGDDATAGLTDSMPPGFKAHWHPNSESYMVETKPLRDILKDSGISRIDLLTIDVEGGELAVLETADFSIPTYVVVIEMDEHNPEKNEACRVILRNNGFVFDRKLCGNEVWCNLHYPFIDTVYTRVGTPRFKRVFDLGKFWHISPHCVKEIEDALRAGRTI